MRRSLWCPTRRKGTGAFPSNPDDAREPGEGGHLDDARLWPPSKIVDVMVERLTRKLS